jgi:hypothetical protein
VNAEGFLSLYGYDSSTDFFQAVSHKDKAVLETLPATATTLLDYAAFRKMRGRFIRFISVGILAAIVAITSVVAAQYVAASASKPPPSVSAPLAVSLVATSEGVHRLATLAQCKHLEESTTVKAQVVAGSLTDATVVVDDSRCRPTRLQWSGEDDGVIVPIAKGS